MGRESWSEEGRGVGGKEGLHKVCYGEKKFCRKRSSRNSLTQRKALLLKGKYRRKMSRIERKYCLISTSYLTGLFDIFILLYV